MKKGKIIAACAGVLLVAAAAGCLLVLHRNGVFEVATPAASSKGGYLFCYFTGNEPEQERIHFAVSKDGYHFTPLNGNHPVIAQTKGTGSVRDPYLFQGQDGAYYILATDMRSADGWNSNHSMISWRSDDLIHWTDETVIDLRPFPQTKSADRVWAPQATFDPEKGEYLIYWSHHNAQGGDPNTVICYAYSRDLKTLSTPPAELFRPANGQDGIDGDIVEKDGVFYLYYKDEAKKCIRYAVADCLTGPYREPEENEVSLSRKHVEGNFIYRIVGTDTFVMMMDEYTNGRFFLQQTEDLIHFKKLRRRDYSLDFQPRHGSVLAVGEGTYQTLLEAYGNS